MKRTSQVAIAALYAALYVSFVAIFPFLSFLQLNVRVANVLKGMVKFWPTGVLLGNFVAVLFGNFLLSPLGFLDVILSPMVSTALLGLAYLIGRRSFLLGLAVNALLLATYLSLLISTVFGLPFFGLLPLLVAGVLISDVVLPYTLYRSLVRLRMPQGRLST